MNTPNKKFLLFCIVVCSFCSTYGQIEISRVQTQNLNAFGFGSYLNFGIPVAETSAISIEGAFTFFTNGDNSALIAPVLAGYRKTLGGYYYGWYFEPMVGYTFGGSDIQKTDASGIGLTKPNGDQIDQSMEGPTACLNFGYLFEPGRHVQFNISLRYERVFVTGDPALNIISLRVAHSIMFGRRP